jgi:sugar/nucleoside kinase (ribokinase family)
MRRGVLEPPSEPSAVCAGYMPLDLVVHERGQVIRRAGGTAANVAAILSYLGWETALAGQVGSDSAGTVVLSDLQKAGVDVASVATLSEAETPRLVHRIDHRQHRFLFRCPCCNRRFPRSRPLSQPRAAECFQRIPNPGLFFFDRANPATVWLAESYARAGSLVVYEPSVPANAELLRRAVEVAHIVKHSDDRSVGGIDRLEAVPRTDQIEMVTHGAQGLELRRVEVEPIHLDALPAGVIDAGGAGDWTTAGFLFALYGSSDLRNGDLVAAARFGQALAALSCEQPGARGLMAYESDWVFSEALALLGNAPRGDAPKRQRRHNYVRPKTDECRVCLLPGAEQARAASRRARAI